MFVTHACIGCVFQSVHAATALVPVSAHRGVYGAGGQSPHTVHPGSGQREMEQGQGICPGVKIHTFILINILTIVILGLDFECGLKFKTTQRQEFLNSINYKKKHLSIYAFVSL